MPPFTIDTNILIYHLKRDENVTSNLERWFLSENRLFISTITRLEILAAPVLLEDEERQILNLLNKFFIIPVDVQIADAAAHIRRTHKLKLGDSIIAATAILTNSTLVTRNLRDFKKVSLLNIMPL